jgi:DNA topoisomerase IA
LCINISNRAENFIANGEILIFPGFLSVYDYLSADDKLLPNLNQGDILNIANFTARESFSRAKPRYTEASLVKKIEEMGIGRPSTFATMVSTVFNHCAVYNFNFLVFTLYAFARFFRNITSGLHGRDHRGKS